MFDIVLIVRKISLQGTSQSLSHTEVSCVLHYQMFCDRVIKQVVLCKSICNYGRKLVQTIYFLNILIKVYFYRCSKSVYPQSKVLYISSVQPVSAQKRHPHCHLMRNIIFPKLPDIVLSNLENQTAKMIQNLQLSRWSRNELLFCMYSLWVSGIAMERDKTTNTTFEVWLMK